MTSRVSHPLSRSRRRLFIGIALAFGVAVPCVAAEVALRIVPLIPAPQRLDIIVEPGGKYQVPDPELGFRPLPGRYQAVFDHKYPWTLTNLPDTTRITKPLEEYSDESPQAGIWIFGCSFTQGWGLDDDQSLPWKVQERLADRDVVNFGVGGYGTLQSLLQFRRALKERPKPESVVVVYANFHDERNVRTAAWRDANYSYERFGTTAQPYARLDRSGDLRYEWGTGGVPLMSLRAQSVAFNAAIRGFGNLHARFLREHEVSERLITQFLDESRRHGITFVLAGITSHDVTRETLAHFSAQGVTTVDISTDAGDPRNLIAYDGHPSGFANEQSADKLAAALR